MSDEDVGGISNERAARQKSARSARQFGEAGEIFGDMTEFLAFTEAEEIEVVEDVAQKVKRFMFCIVADTLTIGLLGSW